MKSALEELLDGPCYHFEELFKHARQRQAWAAYARGEADMDWAVMDDYVAAVDFPACAFYRELAERHPDALILLSVRDLNRWAASWQSLWRYFRWFRSPVLARSFPWVGDIVAVLEAVVVERTFGGDMTPEGMIETHRRHLEEVQREVPAERLLVYRVQEGWEPLCQALGVPVPDRPFPQSNSGSRPFIEPSSARQSVT